MLLAALASGCSGSHDRRTATTAAPTPIARLRSADVRLVRAPFCDRLPATAVRRALGAEPDAHDTWGNGDPVPGTSDSGDIGHELGCSWTATSGATARAWVFARPVTADFATTLVGQAGTQQGCTAQPATVFGTPAILQTCALAGGVQRDRRAGLFGDSWVTCEVAGPESTDPRARLDAWCADVVAALAVRPGG
jgi:hypothetical protein